MNRETLSKANGLERDIRTLENRIQDYKGDHYNHSKELCINSKDYSPDYLSKDFQDDLCKFMQQKKTQYEKELEEL